MDFSKYNPDITFRELQNDGYLPRWDYTIKNWVFYKVSECYDNTQLIIVCDDCSNPFLHWLVEDPVFDVIGDRDKVICLHCFKQRYKEKC